MPSGETGSPVMVLVTVWKVEVLAGLPSMTETVPLVSLVT